jgi:two-component system catabolic regulation response regulator CreB
LDVVWCTTLQEARDRLRAGTVHLIILDVGLPDGNGFDFCKEVRRDTPIPIIFLTARASEIDRVVGLEIGADDYVVKPFSPRELCARVRAVLRRAASSSSSEAEPPAAGFTLDPERMRIHYQDKPLDLSRYEYRLLELLISHPGRVYTRDQLMERVWEEPGSSLDRTVDTHIKTLRAKLRAVDAEADPIQTHRGIGYSLKEPA